VIPYLSLPARTPPRFPLDDIWDSGGRGARRAMSRLPAELLMVDGGSLLPALGGGTLKVTSEVNCRSIVFPCPATFMPEAAGKSLSATQREYDVHE